MNNFFKMTQNKKTIFLLFFVAVIFGIFYFFQNKAIAQIVCDTSYSSTVCFPTSASSGLPSPTGGIQTVVKNILNWMLGLIGVIAIIGFVISGFQYIAAAGSEKTIEIAKRNMTYSIIGVIVALSGYVIILAIDTALRGTSSIF